MAIDLLVGHALPALRTIPDNSIHCLVCSPPYFGLRAYGTEPQVWPVGGCVEHEWGERLPPSRPVERRTPEEFSRNSTLGPNRDGLTPANYMHQTKTTLQVPNAGAFCARGCWRGELGSEPTVELYVEHMVTIFREVRRVLHPSGVVFLNIGDSYAGSGKGPTGWNGIGDQEQRQGFTTMERRKGRGIRGGQNYELRDAPAIPGYKPKDLMDIPFEVSRALRIDGWYKRSNIIWGKKASMPESVDDRPTSAHEPIFLLTKNPRYFWDPYAVRNEGELHGGNAGTFARNGSVRGETLVPGNTASHRSDRDDRVPAGSNMRNLWLLGPEPSNWEYCDAPCDSYFQGKGRSAIIVKEVDGKKIRQCPYCERTDGWLGHYAIFPTEIPRRAIAAGTSERGVCPECLNPWKRVLSHACEECGEPVKRQEKSCRACGHVRDWKDGRTAKPEMLSTDWSTPGMGTPRLPGGFSNTNEENGWEPTCKHNHDPVPATVLDIFMGSGTTALVADRLGRHCVGIELHPGYARVTEHRLRRDNSLLLEFNKKEIDGGKEAEAAQA